MIQWLDYAWKKPSSHQPAEQSSSLLTRHAKPTKLAKNTYKD